MAAKISVGADPEVFLRDTRSGKYVSAHTFLPGTKEKPHPVKFGAIQVDGVAAEFNIDPAQGSELFCRNIEMVMSQLRLMLPNHIEICIHPAAEFDAAYFSSLPLEVRQLGCNPDFNAWTGKQNDAPKGDTPWRYCGGHVHLGWTKDQDVNDPTHFEDCRIVAQQMDYYLGIPSLSWDKDHRRRAAYGKAGSMRVKPYGLEYRALSNRWLISSQLQQWVWYAAFYSINNLLQGNHVVMPDKYNDWAQKIIDSNDSDHVIDEYKKNIFSETGMSWPQW